MIMALKGIKVVEMMGLAPGPFCGTILADFGASVTVVDKLNSSPFDVMSNGKRILPVNLKTKDGQNILHKLCTRADVLLDTFRPGVMENMGLGPEVLMRHNPRLIYARLTGFGQDGLYKSKAGHDINYVAVSGILSMLCRDKEPPIAPVNYMADFAGGGLTCALGILLALIERMSSGKGQVIDSSMTEGAAYVGTWLYKSRNLPIWSDETGNNILEGRAPYYRTYKTKDGRFMAVGALEPQFYSEFLRGLNLTESDYPQTGDKEHCSNKFQEIFLSKTQNEWCKIFDTLDSCVTPVVEFNSADENECNKSRSSFYRNEDDLVLPEVAPKLSRTPGKSIGHKPQPLPGEHTTEILSEIGYSVYEIDKLVQGGHILTNKKSHL